jgi:hypothetical protein
MISNVVCVCETICCAPLHEECPKHHGHKGDPGMIPKTCVAVGERAQVNLVWVRAPGVGNASHPWRLRVKRVRPWANGVRILECSRTPQRWVLGIWQFEWGAILGHRLGAAVAWEWLPGSEGFNMHKFINNCPTWASEVSIGIYVKHRWRWSGCMWASEIIQRSYVVLKLLDFSSPSG